MLKWSASIPTILGEFPAAALLFRKGYVKQGETVVHEERTLRSMYERQSPIIAEDPAFDPNRDKAPPVAPGRARRRPSSTRSPSSSARSR